VDAACRRGERCLYFHFEEPSEQIIRNMHSIGLDLGRWTKRGLLDLQARRPASHTLESHLIYMLRRIQEAKPRILVLDPVSALGALNSLPEVRSMVGRLVAHLKEWQISTLFTSLTEAAHPGEQSEVGISSLVDTWILVRDLESLAERTRGLYIIKSRGMAHSHQVREMLITDHGLRLTDVLVGPDGILTGAQRVRQQLKDQAEAEIWRTEILRRQAQLARRRSLLDSQIAALRAEFEAQKTETEAAITAENLRLGRQAQTLLLQARKRQNNSHPGPGAGRKKTLKRPVG
jgi:circadian clock protein KaiC